VPSNDALVTDHRERGGGGFANVRYEVIWGALASSLLLTQTLLYLVGKFVFGTRLLHADTATAFATWAGTAAVGLAALLALALALFGWRARVMGPMAAIFAFLALDEAIEVHERLARRLLEAVGAESVDAARVWPVLYAPLVAFGAVLLLRGLSRNAPASGAEGLSGQALDAVGDAGRRSRRLGWIGLGCLAAALLTEVVWSAVRSDTAYGGTAHHVAIVIEEGFELGGWFLIGLALLAVVALAKGRRA
jgi:hypothetical protein